MMNLLKVLGLLALLATAVQAQPPTKSPQQLVAEALETMREEKLTPRQAWDQGLITKGTLLRALTEDTLLDPNRRWWSLGDEGKGFVEILLSEFPELLEPPVVMPFNIRYRVAHYFLDKNDPRGAEILEAMIDETPRQGAHEFTIYRLVGMLSDYYDKAGDRQKSVETAYRIKEFTQALQPVSRIFLSAARRATAAGETENAKRLYEEVHSLNHGLASSWAYSQIAHQLLRDGKVEEARAVLRTPFTGKGADMFSIVIHDVLSTLYFQTKEWEAARRHAHQVIKEYEALPQVPSTQTELPYRFESAQRLLKRIDQEEQKAAQVKE